MADLLQQRDRFLALQRELTGNGGGAAPPWLREFRNRALEIFADRGFPTLRDEDWKYTSLAPLAALSFQPSSVATGSAATAGQSVSIVNGRFVGGPNAADLPRGLAVGSLAAACTEEAQVRELMGTLAKVEESPMVALNSAFASDGVFVNVAPGVALGDALELTFTAGDATHSTAAQPRNLIVVGEGAQLTFVESYSNVGALPSFTNATTEIFVKPGAVVRRIRSGRVGDTNFHVGSTFVHLERDASFADVTVDLSGALVRNDLTVRIDGEGAHATLDGLFVTSSGQHIDNHTRVDHLRPHGTSRELYKGILDGVSRGVFHGRINVHPDAQRTDASQTNKNILLSDSATIDTRPQLEIFADDVKCAHGTTIGQIDNAALFYMRSRGIGEAQARGLLTYAFAGEILGRIAHEPIRHELERAVLAKLNSSVELVL